MSFLHCEFVIDYSALKSIDSLWLTSLKNSVHLAHMVTIYDLVLSEMAYKEYFFAGKKNDGH